MSETSTLISCTGKITRAELAKLPTPPATETHTRSFNDLRHRAVNGRVRAPFEAGNLNRQEFRWRP